MTLESELIRRYQGAFTPEECEKYIKYINQFEERNILSYDTDNLTQVDNKSANVTFDYDFPPYGFLAKEIIPKFKPCIDEYIEAVNILKGYKLLTYDLKLKKIPIGGGFHQWHFEDGGIAYSQRKFVIQLYLNDNFEGGETEFLYQNRRELPKQGDVLLFPAGFTHTHRGNPPIGGDKYLITSWALIQDLSLIHISEPTRRM